MATLHFVFGLPGAGKTTLARELADRERGLVFIEDEWVAQVMTAPITSIAEYREIGRRVRALIEPLAERALRIGVDVVFDFAANTKADRAWVRGIFERAGADHVLHVIDADVEVCRARVHQRNRERPAGLYFGEVSDALFDAVVPHIVRPADDEGFRVSDAGQSARAK
ncbi:MAG: ATP-binding protein [Deltaproteobacteria bacterium]|nr:ATP-binding protein [Deltaproteobacteria bacterium]